MELALGIVAMLMAVGLIFLVWHVAEAAGREEENALMRDTWDDSTDLEEPSYVGICGCGIDEWSVSDACDTDN